MADRRPPWILDAMKNPEQNPQALQTANKAVWNMAVDRRTREIRRGPNGRPRVLGERSIYRPPPAGLSKAEQEKWLHIRDIANVFVSLIPRTKLRRPTPARTRVPDGNPARLAEADDRRRANLQALHRRLDGEFSRSVNRAADARVRGVKMRAKLRDVQHLTSYFEMLVVGFLRGGFGFFLFSDRCALSSWAGCGLEEERD
ncbi:hypothetical protein BO94DRAFT_579224 [Aspergillus sclerotioniger CBS 115572]|uniref:Uncharacterized protein n=1 Tax=Aspergillus sclerotioniger CBS 115572 TaxID=1450535 RepID=A0A317V3U2_9EURO|nr:hypothetical protein BO94DRAFT_579224 [Aspergillus sclerotioniger CBS 115572]PWY68943.1 hypothetical protein BO94DRAFT_579224 [Aspergillus sclerotioniger CBS 115572]